MTLYGLRKAIKDTLTAEGLWLPEQIIIRRRTKIWNAVATTIGKARNGQVLVIGTPKGDQGRNPGGRSKAIATVVTIPITLVETAKPDPAEDDETEDLLWQQTVIRLQGNTLGRSADGDNALAFDGFDETDEGNYLIRQTLFRTRFLITEANTPQPPPP